MKGHFSAFHIRIRSGDAKLLILMCSASRSGFEKRYATATPRMLIIVRGLMTTDSLKPADAVMSYVLHLIPQGMMMCDSLLEHSHLYDSLRI
jgi:hypothetical protein